MKVGFYNIAMENGILSIVLIIELFIAVSCGTQPQIEETFPLENIKYAVFVLADEEVLSEAPSEELSEKLNEELSSEISIQKRYISTKAEVQRFIVDINKIINNGSYDMWKPLLSEEYLAKISAPEFLQQISELPAMKSQKIVLKTPREYFYNVVIPSRAYGRIDYSSIDIEFISENRVKAFTITTNKAGETRQNRLYDLEHFGNSWKIID
jgi:hypothetical protein